MKKILYIITAIMIFTSCKSIDKMIESGNYDQALRYGVDKLKAKKNKKTKYVKGLEKAYVKLNNRDLEKIKHLRLQNNNNSLDRVVNLYQIMEDRQNYVYPLMPLISEDGYPATFELRDFANLINTSKIESSDKHYDSAISYLQTAERNKDKLLARKSHYAFIRSNSYFDNYKNNYELQIRAYELGQTNILVEPYVSGSNQAFSYTSEIISQIQISNLNSTWKKYYTENHGLHIDYVATIEVSEIVPGKERERFNSFTNTKEVIDGKKAVKTKNGHVKKDTMGNIIYKHKKIIVSANVEELIREKTAQMSGKIVIVDAINNRHINTIPLNVTHIFEDYSCVFRGDKRALTNEYNKRIKNNCAPFPTDYEMTTNLAHEYRKAAEQSIKAQSLI